MAPGSPPDDPVRGLVPYFIPPQMLQSGASFSRILSVASDAPVRGTGFTPGRSSPGASAVLHSAPDAPTRGVFLSYSLRCVRRSSLWHRVHPRTIQSGGYCLASFRPGCSNPGRLFIVFSPLPPTLQSVAPGLRPDDPVRGLAPCFIPPRMLQSGASFCRFLSVASDAPVRGTGFTPGRSSPGARAEVHAAPDAPIRGVMYLSLFAVFSVRLLRSRQGFGTLPGAHTSIRTAAVALWGLRGLDLFLAACSSSGVGVCRGGVVFCVVVRAGVWCCVCALPGLRVARAPCPGVLLRRRGNTPCLWRTRLAPWRALFGPGCGPARGSGMCVRLRGGGFGSRPLAFRALSLCRFSPACPACLPSSYPLGWPWLDGWSWWSDLVFLSCWAAWPGFVSGAGCSCGVPCCVYGVLGLLAPVHRRACPVCGVACAVSWAAWLLFTGVRALCVVLCVPCPGPPGSCSPACTPCVWCGVYGVLGLLAPVHRCARPVCGVVCTVSWVAWPLFTGVRVLCVVLCVRCPGPPSSCSPVCTLCVWCCVYGVLGLLAPVHRCARSVCGVACTVSWASSLFFTCVYALCVVLRVRCPGPPGSCSPVCTLCVWCCVYSVLGLLAPVHRRARSVCGVACTVSWASWLLFTGVHPLCVVLWVRCLGPLGSCSPACTLCVRCCVRGVLGRLAPVHRCACFCVLCPVYGVLGSLALVHRCARSVCGVVCVVSWAFWPLFCWCARVVCVVLRVRCPGTLGSCSPVLRCAAVRVVFGVRCCVCGVLGLPAPVHRCARPVCGVVWAMSWAAWLLFTGVLVRGVVWCVWCPGPLGSQSPVCLCCVLRGVCGVPGHLAPFHRCARVACVVLRVRCPGSRGSCSPACCVLVRCVVCCARRPRPRGSCSPVCLLAVLRGVCGVGVGVCSRVPYRPRCIFCRAQE